MADTQQVVDLLKHFASLEKDKDYFIRNKKLNEIFDLIAKERQCLRQAELWVSENLQGASNHQRDTAGVLLKLIEEAKEGFDQEEQCIKNEDISGYLDAREKLHNKLKKDGSPFSGSLSWFRRAGTKTLGLLLIAGMLTFTHLGRTAQAQTTSIEQVHASSTVSIPFQGINFHIDYSHSQFTADQKSAYSQHFVDVLGFVMDRITLADKDSVSIEFDDLSSTTLLGQDNRRLAGYAVHQAGRIVLDSAWHKHILSQKGGSLVAMNIVVHELVHALHKDSHVMDDSLASYEAKVMSHKIRMNSPKDVQQFTQKALQLNQYNERTAYDIQIAYLQSLQQKTHDQEVIDNIQRRIQNARDQIKSVENNKYYPERTESIQQISRVLKVYLQLKFVYENNLDVIDELQLRHEYGYEVSSPTITLLWNEKYYTVEKQRPLRVSLTKEAKQLIHEAFANDKVMEEQILYPILIDMKLNNR